MQVRIEQWGKSLALRIPSKLASRAQLQPNSLVELALQSGKLVVNPVSRPKITLDQLLAGITEENLHEEVQTGPAVGGEKW